MTLNKLTLGCYQAVCKNEWIKPLKSLESLISNIILIFHIDKLRHRCVLLYPASFWAKAVRKGEKRKSLEKEAGKMNISLIGQFRVCKWR